ncbi:MAG: PD40 domain-containing protein [Armatimonadetes bacterium]|nr:PD40 domain-containing protein [Armatimonadota bacterium]
MLAGAVAAALLASGCSVGVRRQAAPVGVGLLTVAEVARATDRAALSPLAWSPDGRRYAYGARDGVWIHQISDRAGTRIAIGEVVTAVAWSPVADALAFVDRGLLWVLRPDGKGQRRIPLRGIASRPAWAPGGDRLAVVVQPAPASGAAAGSQLWWTGPDGGIVRQIQWYPAKRIAALAWFPDTLYLFVGLAVPGEEATSEWWRVRIAYPDFRMLNRPPQPALDPVLSPDGEWIAFVGMEAGRERAYAARTDGSALHPLSPPARRITGLAWSRHGDKVAYAVVLDEAGAEIHVVAVSGAPDRVVASTRLEFPDPSAALSLAWAPDDGHLAFGTNTGSFAGPIWLVRFERF